MCVCAMGLCLVCLFVYFRVCVYVGTYMFVGWYVGVSVYLYV